MMNMKLKIILISAALLLSTHNVQANVGKIVYEYGGNFALGTDGNRRDLKKGSEVREGDTLVTGRGRMHIRLIDGGFVSVYPNSEYRIDKFKFSGKKKDDKPFAAGNKNVKQAAENKENRGLFSLLKGAARQVTGLLGRSYNDNFKFKTSVATIGIRGTGFFARICQADCFDADGNPLQDGLHVKNNTGIIIVKTNVGEVVLAQGQSAFAASSEDHPQQTVQPPIAHNHVTPDIDLFDFDEKILDVDQDFEISAVDPVDPSVDPSVDPPSIVLTNLEYITNTNKSFSEPLFGVSDSDADFDMQQNGDAIEHFEGELDFDDGVTVVFDMGGATLVENDKDATLGVLWNRWSGGYTLTIDGSGVTSLDDNIHLIGSAELTQNLPLSGSVAYVSVGGTSPTFSGVTGNQVGTQTVTAEISYGSMEVFTLNITATFSEAVINAGLTDTSGNTFVGSGGNIYPMSGNCMGAGCGGNAFTVINGEASVNMVGTNAEGIYGIYNLTSSGTDENSVSGSYFATETSIAQ